MNSRVFFVSGMASLALALPAAADLQFGVGAGAYEGREFDEETGYGVHAELGFLSSERPIQLFLGARANYIDGLEFAGTTDFGPVSGSAHADLDLFEATGVIRLLVPLGTEVVKLYGEGALGVANLRVSGDADAKIRIGGREIRFNRDFDEDEWTVAWGLGAGLQFDFTKNFGLRVGYEYHSYGDLDIDGLSADSGAMHGAAATFVFKF